MRMSPLVTRLCTIRLRVHNGGYGASLRILLLRLVVLPTSEMMNIGLVCC